ncbi:MAG: type II secretion system F family protein [Tetrasphaera sp.]
MSGITIGFILGLGLFLIWWSCWVPEEAPQTTGAKRTWMDRIGDDLIQAGYAAIGPRALVATCVLLATFTFVVVTGFVKVASIGGCFAVLLGIAPIGLVRAKARKRRAGLREAWPDAVDNITSGVRAGLALPEALAQLSTRGPAQLRPAFRGFAEDYRTTGRFHDSLDRLKARLADPVGDRLVESLRMAREVGGSDLGRLLRTLSGFLREDAKIRAEMETRQSWTVNAARLAVAAPWVVLAMLCTRPEAVQAYASRAGTLVLVGGGVCTVIAYRLMVRIARLPEEDRVLG